MRKKILFVIPGLDAGGGEKSLINLLHEIDKQQYDVGLLLLNTSGIFIDSLPQGIKLIDPGPNFNQFSKPLFSSVLGFLKQGKVKLATHRFFYFLQGKIKRTTGINEQKQWKHFKTAINVVQEFDVAIGFLEKTANYLVVDSIRAHHKIGFIHNDYRKLEVDPEFDRSYFQQLNHILTISEECQNVLQTVFPDLAPRFGLMYNIVSKAMIKRMAEKIPEDLPTSNYILSIGRLEPQKGFDLGIDAVGQLVRKGLRIQWFIIGEGSERKALETQIEKLNLKEHIHLIGLRKNPYPYLKNALIYMQPSRFEGKSIAIDEAKIMAKPILATQFTTVNDQLKDGVTACLVQIAPSYIAEGLEQLWVDNHLRSRLIDTLSSLSIDTTNEIQKLYNYFKL